jgi:UDP-glucose 4-epimerase
LSPYAVAKLAGEHCQAFTQVYGLETVRLRYFNVYGPRQSPDSPYAAVIPLFLQAMLAGRRPHIHGDGLQSRDFTFVTDAVQANLLAAEAPARSVTGKVYNIACGRRTSLLELVGRINELLGTAIEPTHGPVRAGDVRHSQADISAAEADLAYHPQVEVEQGIRLCLEHTRNREGR